MYIPAAALLSTGEIQTPFVPETLLRGEKYKDDTRDTLQLFSYGARNYIGKTIISRSYRNLISTFWCSGTGVVFPPTSLALADIRPAIAHLLSSTHGI